MQNIYLLVGVPGSGKTWVTRQLQGKFEIIQHDDYIDKSLPSDAYLQSILRKAKVTTRPILIETPFSISQYMEPLQRAGHRVIPVFILESHYVVKERYETRDGKQFPRMHESRQATYMIRARKGGHFFGTSEQVLQHLKNI